MDSIRFTPGHGQLLFSYTLSKEDFVKQYRKLNKKKEAIRIYNRVLTDLNKSIAVGDVKTFENLSFFFKSVTEIENRAVLKDYYDNCGNPINNTNLVILACKCNQVQILEYIFCYSSILNNLSIDIGKDAITPHDQDDMCHDCFYYAILSGNVELLEILIHKWPGNYFAENLGELEDVLSSAYEELKLKNVPLSKDIEFYVESKLLNLHMFSNTFVKSINTASDINITKERIQLVLENVNLLFEEYHADAKKIDKRFLYIAKFIARNIHVLKLLLKSSYDKLPWEEIEFCLVSYISSHIKQDENILFNHGILYKFRMLNHLKHFGDKLKKYALTSADVSKLATFPNLKREDVVKQIIDSEPYFKELYLDHQQIKDIYSLQIINHYIKVSVSVDFNEREGQLVVARALQVMGEYLKNTLEFPNLSTTISELLLLTLSKNTRDVVTNLIHPLSFSHLLGKRHEIENMDINFFTSVQKDVKEICSVITDFIFRSKVKIIIVLLKNIVNSKNLDEIKQFLRVFSYVNLDELSPVMFKTRELEDFEKLVEDLGNAVLVKEGDEQKFFEEINNIIKFEKTKLKNVRIDPILEFSSLKALSLLSNDDRICDKVGDLKYNAMLSLNYLTPKIDTYNLKRIVELSLQFCNSASHRLSILQTFGCQNVDSVGQPVSLHDWFIRDLPDEDALQSNKTTIAHMNKSKGNVDKINRIFLEIFNDAQFLIDNNKWTEELTKKFNKKNHFILVRKQITCDVLTEEKYSNWLKAQLSELNSILSKNGCNVQSTKCFSIYKNNKQLQAVVEMLVLDIMSILDISNHLEVNVFHLDDTVPLLIGKCLHTHLEHYNALVDVLVFDPLIAVLVNAQNCTSENILQYKKKFGKSVLNSPSKLKDKKNKDLVIIANQESLFIALESGDDKDLKICLNKGGDIQSRSIDMCTAWHFAAKVSSFENIKLILTEFNLIKCVNVKDIHGHNPLHIAAAYGGKGFVDFFLKDAVIFVNDVDNSGKTPLHIASVNGHKNTVESLLRNKADMTFCDKNGLTALYYAIRNGHIDVVKFLFEIDSNIDLNETMSGFFPLHEAAGRGFLEMVIFLFQNGAKINMKDDQDWTPLLTSTFNGHVEVVRYLISNDADVNIKGTDGSTPLFYAVQNGEEEIVNILLKHGAQANVLNKTLTTIPSVYSGADGHKGIFEISATNDYDGILFEGVTPMHIAAKCGHINIVAVFLEHGFDIDVRSKNNSTSLHFAAYMGHKSVVDLLIKNKAQVNAKDYSGFTPLHVAASKGHAEVVDLLMINKAEVNARTNHGVTPLHLAALNGKNYTIESLIKHNGYVNNKDNNNKTPLYSAVQNGHKYSIILLLKNNAEVNARDNDVTTPLHVAAMKGYKDITDLLIKHNAKVHVKDKFGRTPLHLAVEEDHRDVVDTLIQNGALKKMGKDDKRMLLSIAILNNCKRIVEVLMVNGVNVNYGFILSAVFSGHSDIVKLFLRNKASMHFKRSLCPLLLVAAERGYKEIMCDLIKHNADVNVIVHTSSPISLAAKEGHSEVVELLIANRANIDYESYKGLTPLHTAATLGHSSVVKVLLYNNAKINITLENRTAMDAAVLGNHLQVVKIMLKHKGINVNSKGHNNFTLLHMAAQVDYVGMVEYLIQEGADIHAKTMIGAKPIHVAAENGFKSIVEFLISKGSSISDRDLKGQTVLHYATLNCHFELVEYLVKKEKCNVNVLDLDGLTPMHIAAHLGYEDVVMVLLENGAIYNVPDIPLCGQTSGITEDPDIADMLIITEKLFKFVKNNSPSAIEKIIEDGAFVNAKNAENGTPLHYAAWKGYIEVVKVLLKKKANPNAVHTKGFTPLHYAAKFSHLEIVKVLLRNGAMYNAVSDTGKTPSDIAVGNSIINLLNILNKAFKNVKSDNPKVIKDLTNMKDINTVKAVLSACNKENKTLVVSAILNNFSKVNQLKEILQGDVSSEIGAAFGHFRNHNMAEALHIFKRILEIRKEIFGPDNPATLDIQSNVASIYFAQGSYEEALDLYEDIFGKEKEMLGLKHKNTLKTRNAIALTLFRLQKSEALDMFKENYSMHREIRQNHSETLKCQLYIAMLLFDQGKYDEAFHLGEEAYRMRMQLNQVTAMRAQINMAQVIAHQGKLEEAMDIYNEVLEQTKIYFDDNHLETLRTARCIAELLFKQKKYPAALKANEDLLDTLNKVLEPNDLEILFTKYNMANVLFAQCKWIQALIIYKDLFHKIKTCLRVTKPCEVDILRRIELIHIKFKCESTVKSDEDKHYSTHELRRKYISIAANNGDIQTMHYLLKNGVDVNDKDTEGRTSLHYVCNNGYKSVVKYLLENGADAMQATNKGNTPLHTAVSKGYIEIVQVLLQHVSCDKLNNFINAQTATGGNTSLHVAAKNGSLEIVLYLLEYGAIYNIKNKEGCSPLGISSNRKVSNLLKLLEELFDQAKTGDIGITSKLKAVQLEHISAVTNAQDDIGKTLLQIAIAKKHQSIAGEILRTLYVELKKTI